jgi:dTDP-4-amino-4,6-dideoxygalactose transaminase
MRDEVLRRLIKKRIFPSMHFIPIHHHSFFRRYYGQALTLPVAEDLAAREISLPIYPDLKKEDVIYIAATLKTVIRSIRGANTGR